MCISGRISLRGFIKLDDKARRGENKIIVVTTKLGYLSSEPIIN